VEAGAHRGTVWRRIMLVAIRAISDMICGSDRQGCNLQASPADAHNMITHVVYIETGVEGKS